MTAGRGARPSIEQRLQAEFGLIRANVAGVHGCIVATSDGFLVAHSLPDLDPADLAALLAASRALASQGVTVTGRGEFREAITRGTLGYLAIYAAGDSAIVAVVGDIELNVGMLHFRVHDIVERIATYTSEFRRWSAPAGAAPGPARVAEPWPSGEESPAGLPVRRRQVS
jgi:predicted regulator of Ras-like GTPase activity (Roadblock/LC7/MglB family)